MKRTKEKESKKVKIPMMPKGVEHEHGEKEVLINSLVKIPMMPKGVEHFSPASNINPTAL